VTALRDDGTAFLSEVTGLRREEMSVPPGRDRLTARGDGFTTRGDGLATGGDAFYDEKAWADDE
jgi:hypothetical protein